MISLSFTGFIWKILPNADKSLLLLELRDESTRQTSFAAVDIESKKLLWEQKNLPEKWWISLLDTQDEKVLLHGFKSLQSPERLKIFVLNIADGKLLWKNDELIPINFYKKNVLTKSNEEPGLYFLHDGTTGKKVQDLDEEQVNSFQYEEKKIASENLKNPHYYSSENRYFQKLSSFVEAVSGKTPVHAMEYAEFENKIIISFYINKGEKLVNYMLITNQEGEVIIESPICEGLSGIASDTFFLWKDKLIFIKNRKELVIFELK